MSLTKQSAWLIFESDKLGQEQGKNALKNMSKDEFDAYECWVEDFEMELAKVAVEAQNEAATLMQGSDDIAYLLTKKPWLWTATDYAEILNLFKNSKFEQLHLSAFFKVQNAELLLSLAKPA